ncbi:hypothetical protein TrVFT333_000575 [Trichoderma virens FT-333]|nr:hypothetical protein TrVFT333_000575 [Trichoderma virens FT-333]
MDPTKDDPKGHQHEDQAQDQVTHKQEPQEQSSAEDENHLLPPHINRATSSSSTISSGYGPTFGMYPADDEGLPEVVPDSSPQALSRLEAEYKRKFLDGDAPQTVIPKDVDTNKIAVMAAGDGYSVEPDGMSGDIEGARAAKKAGNRICGLSRKMFLILVIVAVVVLAAAIGGGVGGGLAAKKSNGDSPDAAAASETTSRLADLFQQHTTTDINTNNLNYNFLNNQTTSGNTFAFQAFADDTFLGNATAIIDDEGGTDLGFEAHSYVWVPSVSDCCITFCTNATSKGMVGWLCSQRKQPKSSDAFKRVYVWCHKAHEKPNAICIDPKT